MSSIAGYVGRKTARDVVLPLLWGMKFSGYDSVGMATIDKNDIHVCKGAGRLIELERYMRKKPLPGTIGIGHLRWATHGAATDENAHPHLSNNGRVAIVQNGVIENYREIRDDILDKDIVFLSQTDSEVIVNLIEKNFSEGRDLFASVAYSVSLLSGIYAIAVMSSDCPDVLIGACCGSEMVIGLDQEGMLMVSNQSALPRGTKKVTCLKNGLCIIKAESAHVIDRT